MQSRLDTLKEMGIEVWRLRSNLPAVPAPSPQMDMAPQVNMARMPPASIDHPITKIPEQSPVSQNAGQEKTPRFRFAYLHYGSVGLCLSLAGDSALPRRFCDDLARFMGGDVDGVRFQMLEWPMLETSGIDQSMTAARQVVTQKFSVMPAKIIVFGDDVAEYYGPLEKVSSVMPVTVGRQQYLCVASLKTILGSAEDKRSLLQVLNSWG